MENYKIDLSDTFYVDLKFIQDIIFRFTFSKQIVNSITSNIFTKIYLLENFPYRCVAYKYLRELNIKGKYKVFYHIDETNKRVEIYRILFSSSNYEEIF